MKLAADKSKYGSTDAKSLRVLSPNKDFSFLSMVPSVPSRIDKFFL